MTNSDQTKRSLVFVVSILIMAYGLWVSTIGAMAVQSADLFATWLAAEFYHAGQMDQIYPAAGRFFTMTTPSEWWDRAVQTDPEGRIFPYIYPPLWVALFSGLTPLTDFATFDLAFLIVHQIALFGTVVCASRLLNLHGQAQLVFVALTYVALTNTMPALLALSENQPQILVSFLIVLAFERMHTGHARQAGAVLALAAAIKLYPVLFVVIFIGRRQWRALASFAIVGGGLGLASIALAGWPLHAEYLQLIKTMTRSVVITNNSYSIDALISGVVWTDHITYVRSSSLADGDLGWYAIAKSPLWATISAILTLAALAGAATLAARNPNDPFVLPTLAVALALLSPLTWSYTYLTAFVFVGALPARLGKVGWGVAIGIAVVFFRSTPLHQLGLVYPFLSYGWVVCGLVIMVFFLSLLAALWRSHQSEGEGADASRPPAPFLPMPNRG